MTVLDIFLGLVQFLCYLFTVLILVRSVVSWFSPRPTNVLVVYLHRVTEPLLSPLRRVLPRARVVDFSPLVAILLLYLLIWILGLVLR